MPYFGYGCSRPSLDYIRSRQQTCDVNLLPAQITRAPDGQMNAAALPLAWVLMWVGEESVMTLNASRTETSQSGCQ
ncbi:hypothetical protein BN439_0931 [Erwinia amylovora Ea644]|nr:hypothetical protein BN439_0931 [Erwinia amylovora Ea644]CCP06038.1 hypothetical protein BN440_0988 [Erwinia amylovora MR1]